MTGIIKYVTLMNIMRKIIIDHNYDCVFNNYFVKTKQNIMIVMI